jgi:hypothetical protein
MSTAQHDYEACFEQPATMTISYRIVTASNIAAQSIADEAGLWLRGVTPVEEGAA